MVKQSTLKSIFMNDMTYILAVFMIALALTFAWNYYENYVLNFFPQIFQLFIFKHYLIQIFFTFMIGVMYLQDPLTYMAFSYTIFQSLILMVIMIAAYVLIIYYLAYLFMEKHALRIKRSRMQNIAKILALMTGIGVGAYLTIVTFPFGNLFNYNFFSWVVFNIEEYIRNMFEFTLLMTVSGVGIGYFFVLITDLAFHAYYKVTKKTLIRKIKGYEWASQEEVKIKDAFDAIQKKITRTQKKKDGKGTATFLIFLVTCTAFFTIKIAISQTGSIHVKFSPNFITLGDFDPLNGSVVITGLSVISAPLSREQLMFSWLQGLLTPDIILSLSYVYGTHHFMLMSYQFMGGMDFTFHTPKDNNIYAVLVTYRFKYNLTEQWIETGNSFFVNYFSSSVVPKSITIDAIYIANYTPSTNVTSGAVRSSLLLGNVQDSWLHLYDYLLYW